MKATEIDFNNKGLEAADRITIQVGGIPAQSVIISETGLNTALEALRNSAIAAGVSAEYVEVDNGVLRFLDRSSYPSVSATIEAGIDVGVLDFTGITFSTGDKIKLTLADGSTVTGAIGAGGLAATLSDIASQIAMKNAMFTEAAVNGNQLVITGLADASPLGNIDVSLTKEGLEVANLASSSITNASNAGQAIVITDQALQDILKTRTRYGAATNQLIHAIDNLTEVKINAESSMSRIKDADYATETSRLAASQIINEAATAMLAQANNSQELIMSLIKDWL